MAAMFKALESTDLRGFLGCSSGIYEADLVAFFQNALAGSLDAVTHERFLLMTAIHCGLKINWKNTRLALCEPKPFPTLKVLNVKTVGTYVAKQKGTDDGNEGDEPVMATAVVVKKKVVTKKRTAPTTADPVAKKKRTTVGRSAPAEKDLAMVPVVQNPEPISVVPAATPETQRRRRAPKNKLTLPEGSDDEIVDSIIHQVIVDTAAIETGEPDLEEPVIKETAEIVPSLSFAKPAATTSRSIHEKTSQNDTVPTNLNDIVKVTSASLPPAGSPVATHYSQQPLAAGSIRNTQNATFQLNETTSLHFYDWFPKPAAGHSKLTHLLIQ
ncbi:hypothetical protein F511_31196 [Dorcoceras hygrometricum]|uniref:Uncharacterized protein n=1 Tax=Dorcoceras hygrometricum TaxID=472368 RepID=A0A2Z7APP6_9LAMI|nr:hypothetical protein F511_31196 [Dorcoceras hygrometricum]